jgi:hypothetical protein
MSDAPVTVTEFESRLIALLAPGGGPGLPRRPRDRHILFHCAVRTLAPGRGYPQSAVNERLDAWLNGVGSALELDCVSLRREMVDTGYLERDPAGLEYRPRTQGNGAVTFLPEVGDVDPETVLREARARAEARRRRALGS